MKAKITRNVSISSTLDYIQQSHKQHERIAGTVSGSNTKEILSEYRALEQLRPDIAKPTWHASLSLPIGEHLDSQRWAELCNDFVREMGLGNHLWLAARHQDTDYDHVHLIASRIALDGSIWLGQNEARRAIALSSHLEVRYGLQQTKPYEPDAPNRCKRLTKNEIEMSLRTQQLAPRAALQEAVNYALAGKPSLISFIESLESAGIGVRLNSTASGYVSGLTFTLDGIHIKASQLGKAYGWAQLRDELNYDQDRDGKWVAEWTAQRAAAIGRTGNEVEYIGSESGNSDQSNRRPKRCNSRQPESDIAVTRSSSLSLDGGSSAIAELNRRREAFRGNGSRLRARGAGTGAAATATRRISEAEILEIRTRKRPVRGAADRLAASLAVSSYSNDGASQSHGERGSNCSGISQDRSGAEAGCSGALNLAYCKLNRER